MHKKELRFAHGRLRREAHAAPPHEHPLPTAGIAPPRQPIRERKEQSLTQLIARRPVFVLVRPQLAPDFPQQLLACAKEMRPPIG